VEKDNRRINNHSMHIEHTAWHERRSLILLVSLALYIAACCLPAILLHTGGWDNSHHWVWSGYERQRGIDLLFAGLFGLLLANFAVLANPTAMAELALALAQALSRRGHSLSVCPNRCHADFSAYRTTV
jgi:hypothetical protein